MPPHAAPKHAQGGRPIVFLHGFAHTHRQWHDVAARLNQAELGQRCFLQLPFHEGPPVSSFAEAVDCLWEQAGQHCGPGQPVVLVGYSLGARLALAMAVAAPHRVQGLLLVSGHPGLSDVAARTKRRAADAVWAARFAAEPVATALAAFRQQAVFTGGPALRGGAASQASAAPAAGGPENAQQQRAAAAHAARLSLDGRALAAHFAVLGLAAMPCFEPHLSALTMPTATVVGARDQKFCRLAAAMGASLSNHSSAVVPGAGHDVVGEAPAAVAAALRALCRRVQRAASPGGA